MQNAKQMNSGLKHVLEAGIEELRLPEVQTNKHTAAGHFLIPPTQEPSFCLEMSSTCSFQNACVNKNNVISEKRRLMKATKMIICCSKSRGLGLMWIRTFNLCYNLQL